MELERMRFAHPGNFEKAMDGMVLGAKWDKESSPTLIRTDGAVGLIAQAGVDDGIALNDFDQMPIYSEMRDVTDHLGNVFVRIPKFYIRKVDEPGLKQWQISKTWREGYYLPWCFYDAELDTELPYIDVGKYNASIGVGDKLESKPGTYPLINKTIVNFRTYARANNTGGLRGYQQMDIHVYDVLSTLFYVEFATLNSQAVMQGFTTGQYSSTHTAVIAESDTNRIIVPSATANLYRVGQAISLGTSQGGNQIAYGRAITAIEGYDADNKAIVFDGSAVNIAVGNFVYNTGWKSGFSSHIAASSGSIISGSDGKHPCMYRGIENPWGSVWQWADGVNINDWQAWVCNDAAQYASNVFASPYKQLGYTNHDTSGYPTEMGHDPDHPCAEFPVAIQTSGVSASKYYCDYYYQSAGQRVGPVGGDWRSGSYAGLSCWYLAYSSGGASVAFGGRLLRKPL